MKKPQLKKWAVAKAIEILKENGDDITLNFLLKRGNKKDDHGDVICYTTAWFKILNVGFFTPPQCQIQQTPIKAACPVSRSARLRR